MIALSDAYVEGWKEPNQPVDLACCPQDSAGAGGIGSAMEARLMAEIAAALRVGLGDVFVIGSGALPHLGALDEVRMNPNPVTHCEP